MGAQDNLTNVLAVVLGVAIGSGDLHAVALAGPRRRARGSHLDGWRAVHGDALIAGAIPLAPFAPLPMGWAAAASVTLAAAVLGVLLRQPTG